MTIIDRPMWCDDFDMDLPKVIPESREIVGDLGDVLLYTNGQTWRSTLNHPNVWNHDLGMVAFFGFNDPGRDCNFYRGSGQIVECTFWEAIRDAWPHQFYVIVERRRIWDAQLWPQFQDIMYDLRGWQKRPKEAERARRVVRQSLGAAVLQFRSLYREYEGRARRLTLDKIVRPA